MKAPTGKRLPKFTAACIVSNMESNRPSGHIETSIPSYVTVRPPRGIIGAARQQLTLNWWENHRHQFDLFVSRAIQDEASAEVGYDLRKRFEQLKKLEEKSKVPVVDRSSKQPQPTVKAGRSSRKCF